MNINTLYAICKLLRDDADAKLAEYEKVNKHYKALKTEPDSAEWGCSAV